MTVPLRAALYLRVSTARQAEHDVSIPDQNRQAGGLRYRHRPLVQPFLPRPLRARVLRPQARKEWRQAGLDHPGDGRRSDARYDAADHGAVRRVPIEGERQACSPRVEGERTARLLERPPPPLGYRVVAAGRDRLQGPLDPDGEAG